MTYKTLPFHELGVTPDDVFQQMGYGNAAPSADVAAEVGRLLQQAAAVARPQYAFRVLPGLPNAAGTIAVQPADGSLGTTLQVGAVIARQLRDSEAFAVFVATAGMEFESWRHIDDPLQAYVADAIGSVVAEKCADRMEAGLQAAIDKLGWKHTNRFSPGYCGWNVAQQQLLFGLFDKPEPCGIRLNASSLMVPVKSVSGIIGLGTAVSRRDYVCALCNLPHCFKRKNQKAQQA